MCSFFFFNDTATTEIYTLSLHDALPILTPIGYETINPTQSPFYSRSFLFGYAIPFTHTGVTAAYRFSDTLAVEAGIRSEEHTSELQSRQYLVCRLLLEKKKKQG